MDYQELLLKFFAGEISDEELGQLKIWLSKTTENRRIFDQKNNLWQEASFNSRQNNFDVDSAWERFSSMNDLGGKKKAMISVNRNTFRIITAAASFAALVIIGIFSIRSFGHLSGSSVIVATNDGEKAHIFLSDSTEVILNSGTTIEYGSDYNIENRVVRLKGEAFFNVHSNKKKPFVVLSDKVRISATGTRFNVLSFPEENNIEATLEQGAISFACESRGTVKIKPGEQIVYSKRTGEVSLHKIRTDNYTSWKENKLRFNDTPLEETFRKIARRYNVTFELKDIDLLDLKYTGTFIDEDIVKVMELLGAITPITYKIIYRTSESDNLYVKPKIIVAPKNKVDS